MFGADLESRHLKIEMSPLAMNISSAPTSSTSVEPKPKPINSMCEITSKGPPFRSTRPHEVGHGLAPFAKSPATASATAQADDARGEVVEIMTDQLYSDLKVSTASTCTTIASISDSTMTFVLEEIDLFEKGGVSSCHATWFIS